MQPISPACGVVECSPHEPDTGRPPVLYGDQTMPRTITETAHFNITARRYAAGGHCFARPAEGQAAAIRRMMTAHRMPSKRAGSGWSGDVKRDFPLYRPGMSTAQYVALYEAGLSGCLRLTGGADFWAPLNTEPATLYEGGALDFAAERVEIEAEPAPVEAAAADAVQPVAPATCTHVAEFLGLPAVAEFLGDAEPVADAAAEPVAAEPEPVEAPAPAPAPRQPAAPVFPLFARLAIERLQADSALRSPAQLAEFLAAYAATYGEQCADETGAAVLAYCVSRWPEDFNPGPVEAEPAAPITIEAREPAAVADDGGFSKRVTTAAAYISTGRRTSRAFDSCFEMWDGDAVAVALIRRAEKRPGTNLAANIWRYLARHSVEASAARQPAGLTLAEWSRALVAERAPAADAPAATAAPAASPEEIRAELVAIEAEILALAPAKYSRGQYGSDIEAAAKSRAVPAEIRARRQELRSALRAAVAAVDPAALPAPGGICGLILHNVMVPIVNAAAGGAPDPAAILAAAAKSEEGGRAVLASCAGLPTEAHARQTLADCLEVARRLRAMVPAEPVPPSADAAEPAPVASMPARILAEMAGRSPGDMLTGKGFAHYCNGGTTHSLIVAAPDEVARWDAAARALADAGALVRYVSPQGLPDAYALPIAAPDAPDPAEVSRLAETAARLRIPAAEIRARAVNMRAAPAPRAGLVLWRDFWGPADARRARGARVAPSRAAGRPGPAAPGWRAARAGPNPAGVPLALARGSPPVAGFLSPRALATRSLGLPRVAGFLVPEVRAGPLRLTHAHLPSTQDPQRHAAHSEPRETR